MCCIGIIKIKKNIMKKNYKKLFAICITAGFLLTGLNSCKKDDPTPAQKNIVEIVVSDPNFSLLKQAVVRAGLTSALSSGTLTVFAPDNAAFAAAGIDSATIASIPENDLATILKYHVLNAKVEAAGVPASDTVNTLDGLNLYASSNANGVFVNGIKVKSANVQAANGVIHVISDVLIPPTDNIAEVVSSDDNFDILLAAVVRAGLASAVSSNGKYTVFAPTDAAFAALPAGVLDALLLPENKEVLVKILTYHVVPASVLAADVTDGDVATVEGQTVKLSTANGVTVNGANVVTADVLASNGVIHAIDAVLVPADVDVAALVKK